MQMATTPRPHFKAGLALAFAVLAAALALPSAAAAEQGCFGSLKTMPKTAERDTGVSFEFACREPAKAFTLIATQELISFDASADVFDSVAQGEAIRGDDRFGECAGEIPSFGFVCAGTYSALGRLVRGNFDTTKNPCARDKVSRKQLLHASIVVLGTTGTLSGPYELDKPTGCPRSTASTKKHERKAAH
jgi:hypothetical protein